jgi:hypothetical protein
MQELEHRLKLEEVEATRLRMEKDSALQGRADAERALESQRREAGACRC